MSDQFCPNLFIRQSAFGGLDVNPSSQALSIWISTKAKCDKSLLLHKIFLGLLTPVSVVEASVHAPAAPHASAAAAAAARAAPVSSVRPPVAPVAVEAVGGGGDVGEHGVHVRRAVGRREVREGGQWHPAMAH